jgi:DNA-directed RNA polymerase specialized sigma24 family protein
VAQDDDAFTEFVATRSVALLRLAYLLTGDRERAESLLRTTLSKAFTRWRGLREPRAAESEVRKAMVRTVISPRKQPSRDRELVVMGPYEPPVEEAANDAGGPGGLWPIVRALPPRQRAVLVLRYHEELTESETATILGRSTRSATTQLTRALQTLRTDERSENPEDDDTTPLEDRLRAELNASAYGVEFRPDFVVSSVENVLARRRRQRRRQVRAVAAAIVLLAIGGVAIGTPGGDDDARKSDVDLPLPPIPSTPVQLDPADIQQPPRPEDIDALSWRDTFLPQVLPVDVANAPPLSEDPIDHALALVAGEGTEVGVVGDDGRLRRLDGVVLGPRPDPSSATSSPVAKGSLTPDGSRAAFPQADAVVVVDLATGDSERFGLLGPNTRVTWFPDGQQVLVSQEGGSTSVLDTADGSIGGEPYSAYRAALLPDGTALELRETGDWPARSDLITWQDNGTAGGVPILLRHRSETPASATAGLLVVAATYEDPDAASASGETGWVVVDIATAAPVTMLRAPTAWYDTWLYGLHGWLDSDTVLIQTADYVIAWTPDITGLQRVTEVTTDVSLAMDAIQ